MMGDLVNLFGNKLGYPLGYPHVLSRVVCGSCHGNTFHVEAEGEKGGNYYFRFLVCTHCGNTIPIDIKYVFKKDGETLNDDEEEVKKDG